MLWIIELYGFGNRDIVQNTIYIFEILNMTKHRHSIRLKNYDYSQSGIYYVTICTQNRECLFGDIINGKMKLNSAGKIIDSVWKSLSKRFPIVLDEFQIMPNHVHMIVNIVGAGFMPAHTYQGQEAEFFSLHS